MNNINDEKGSLTIEAAIILPIVITVFLLIFTMMHMVYAHAKVQSTLNKICIELSYDSYLFYEMGITSKLHDISKAIEGEKLTIEDIESFREQMANDEMKSLISDELFNGSDTLSYEADGPLSFFESSTKVIETVEKSVSLGNKVGATLLNEGVYFMTTSLGRGYILTKLKEYLPDDKYYSNLQIEHLELFGIDNTGVVVVSFDYQFPLGLFDKKTVKLCNSSYIHLFSGHGDYSEKFHKEIKTSTYGEGANVVDSITDEDGYYKKVYVTEHGTKYHKNPVCFHIFVNSYPTMSNSIPDKRPCIHCATSIEEDDNILVYTTPTSDVFHLNPSCYSIYHNLEILSEKEVLLKGYEPCASCSK